jgi:hypothetical protein
MTNAARIRVIGADLTGWTIEIVDYSGPHTLESAMDDVQRIEAKLKLRHKAAASTPA